MWLSRKKYNEMVEELRQLREETGVFEKYLQNFYDDQIEDIEKELREECNEYTEKLEDTYILRKILDSDISTRTKICGDMGIAFKTLRNILDGKLVKHSTKEKIKKYIYNEDGSIKKEILDIIS